MKKKLLLVTMVSLVLIVMVSLVFWPELGSQNKPKELLKGSYRIEKNGWIFVHLEGPPFQVGFQHGFWLADNLNYSWSAVIHLYWSGVEFGDWWYVARDIAREYVWPKIPDEYRDEIMGIVDGLRTAGYYDWDEWDIVAFNAWSDIDAYWDAYFENEYLHNGYAHSGYVPLPRVSFHEESCSAFIATGNATKNGEIVIAHNTWYDYAGGDCNVIFHITPKRGYEILYQSSGGCMWSGQDWIMNSAGLMVCETTLPDMEVYNVNGTPIFVRERSAMQDTDNIDDWLEVMTSNGNGAYANEWLIGDAKTGEICSLQLGCYHWDLNRTFNGFIGSCNYPKGEGVRQETTYNWKNPTTSGYCRYERWQQLYEEYNSQIDVEIAKTMIADHYDVLTGQYEPSERTICGHGEVSSRWRYEPIGAYDGKVTSSTLVLENMGMWGRWGHPCGTPFIVKEFLEVHSGYSWQLPYLHDLPYNEWTLFNAEGPEDR